MLSTSLAEFLRVTVVKFRCKRGEVKMNDGSPLSDSGVNHHMNHSSYVPV